MARGEAPALRRARRARIPSCSKLHDLRTRTSGHRDFAQFHVDLPDRHDRRRGARRSSSGSRPTCARAFPGLELVIHIDPEGHVDEPGNTLVETDEFARLESKP